MAKTKYAGFTSYEQTRPHLMFHPKDIDLLNTVAALERRTLSRQIEVIVTAWLTEYKALKANRAAEAFASDKARNGDDSWAIKE